MVVPMTKVEQTKDVTEKNASREISAAGSLKKATLTLNLKEGIL